MKAIKRRKVKILFLFFTIVSIVIMLSFVVLYYSMMNNGEDYSSKDTREFNEKDYAVKEKVKSDDLEIAQLSLKDRVLDNIEDINNCEIEHTYFKTEEGRGEASSFTFEFNNVDESKFKHKIDFKGRTAFVSETWRVDWYTTFGGGQDFNREEKFKIYVNDTGDYYLYTDFLEEYTSRKDMENKSLKVGYYIYTHKDIDYYEDYFTEIDNVLRSLEDESFKEFEVFGDNYVFEINEETAVAEAFATDLLIDEIDDEYKDNTEWYKVIDHTSSVKYYVDKKTELPDKIVVNYSYEIESEKFEPTKETVEITETYSFKNINELEQIQLPQGVNL